MIPLGKPKTSGRILTNARESPTPNRKFHQSIHLHQGIEESTENISTDYSEVGKIIPKKKFLGNLAHSNQRIGLDIKPLIYSRDALDRMISSTITDRQSWKQIRKPYANTIQETTKIYSEKKETS